MKNFICLLLLILSISNAKGQNFISMIDTTLEWTGCFNYEKDGVKTNSPIKYRFINKDTVFKADTFKVLMAYTEVDTFIMGGLRENSISKRAYGFYSGDTTAYLMYDFSFPIGTAKDTLWVNQSEPDSNYLVSVSRAQDFTGKFRKRNSLCCDYSYHNTDSLKFNKIEWVEGLGSQIGVLHNIIINTLPQFRYPNTPNRPLHFAGIEKVTVSNNILFFFGCFSSPNSVASPSIFSKEEVEVSLTLNNSVLIQSKSKIKKISFHQISGKEVLFTDNINLNKYEFKVFFISRGIYYLKILTDKKETYKKIYIP